MAGSLRKVLLKENVWDAAKRRINWLFDEFENIIVSTSGGKDSTVIMELCLIVARERGEKKPLPVMFLDQEGEWQGTIDYLAEVFKRPEIQPIWIQSPFRMHNAVSFKHGNIYPWDPKIEDRWIRPKVDFSIKTDEFTECGWGDIFQAILKRAVGKQKACYIGGVRAEESPNRMKGLCYGHTYGGVTWGKGLAKDQYTFYPLYDWTYQDIWASIHQNQWSYNRIYDEMFRYGIPVHEMRISSLFHETAVRSLFYLQEFEPDTYNRFTQRIEGADMAGKMGYDDFYVIDRLPYMFKDWKDYRDYLNEKLVMDAGHREAFTKKFADMDARLGWIYGDGLYKKQINAILTNDFQHTKLNNVPVPKELWDEYKARENARREKGSSAKDPSIRIEP